jgi:hypothetical protein
MPASEHDRLDRVAVGRHLARQHVAEQRDALDVGALPAKIARADAGDAVVALLSRRRLHRACHHEHGRLEAGRHHVVARRHAARHLEVDELVGRAAALGEHGDELPAALEPLVTRMRIDDPQLGEAPAEARHVLVEAEQLPRVDRHHLVDAVAEDEAAVENRDLRLGERKVFAVEVAQRVGKMGLHGASSGRSLSR